MYRTLVLLSGLCIKGADTLKPQLLSPNGLPSAPHSYHRQASHIPFPWLSFPDLKCFLPPQVSQKCHPHKQGFPDLTDKPGAPLPACPLSKVFGQSTMSLIDFSLQDVSLLIAFFHCASFRMEVPQGPGPGVGQAQDCCV